MAVGIQLKLTFRGADVDTAFLNAKLNREVYVSPPAGTRSADEVWRLLKGLYGLQDAPLLWNKLLVQTLVKAGYTQCKSEPCLFVRAVGNSYSIAAVIVDDIFFASSPPSANDRLIHELSKSFGITDLGFPTYIIGLHFQVQPGRGTLSQELYITEMAKRYGQLTSKPVRAPALVDAKLSRDMGSPPTKRPYKNLVGSLLYATITRPDVSTAISKLARYMAEPQEAHYNAAIRVLRYLYTTKSRKLIFVQKRHHTQGQELTAFTDSTWNTCPDTSRSRGGHILLLWGSPILWVSKLQTITALSSCEAEYVQACLAARDVVWIRRVLREILLPQQAATTMYIDNQSAMKLAKHLMTKPASRHILLRYHWLRDQVRDGRLKLEYVNTDDNLADPFTKVLPKFKYQKFVDIWLTA